LKKEIGKKWYKHHSEDIFKVGGKVRPLLREKEQFTQGKKG